MDIDDRRVADLPERAGGEFAFDRGEGIVEGVHEQTAHDVDDEHASAVPGLDQRRAATGRSGRIIGGTQQARLPLDEDERFPLVEGVVAQRHNVGAGRE